MVTTPLRMWAVLWQSQLLLSPLRVARKLLRKLLLCDKAAFDALALGLVLRVECMNS